VIRRSLKALESSLEKISNLNRRKRKKDEEEGSILEIVPIGSKRLR
jgi:hypothetical protein